MVGWGVGVVLSLVGGLLGGIPVLGALVNIVLKVLGSVIGIYGTIGIVLSILDYLKVLK